jgi:ABC-type transport system involved in multi-copper enzyme maturation permease subunit
VTALGWTGDPLAARELGSFSRRPQTYLVRVLYVGLTAWAVWAFWRSAASDTVSDLAYLGRELFHRFFALQMVLVPLAAAAAASDLVAREARAGTLGLLVLTGMDPRGIAWAKWRAAMFYAALLLLAGLPVVAVCVYLGSAGPLELAWSSATTLSLAAVTAATAVRFSASCETGGRAFARTILSLAGWSCAIGLATLPFTLHGIPVLSWAHPVWAALSAVDRPTEAAHAWSWTGALTVSGLATFFLLRDAGRRIGRRVTAAPRARATEHGYDTTPSYYSKRIAIARGVWERNPLLWKELATRALARIPVWGRIGLLWLFISVAVLAWGFSGEGRVLEGFYLPGAGFLLYAVGWGSFLFAREKEGRRWDLLLSTPVRASEIVSAKLLSGLVAPESLFCFPLLFLCVAGWSHRADPLRFLLTGLVVALFLGFAYVLAAAASLLSRTPRTAFGLASGLVAVIVGALPVLLDVRRDFLSPAFLVALSPLPALEEILLIGRREWTMPRRILDGRALEVGAFFAAFYGGATASLVAAMIAAVRRRAGIQ